MVSTFQPIAMLLLLITANGVFEPLEVALNRAWGGHSQPLVPTQSAGQPRHDLPVRRAGAALANPDRHEFPMGADYWRAPCPAGTMGESFVLQAGRATYRHGGIIPDLLATAQPPYSRRARRPRSDCGRTVARGHEVRVRADLAVDARQAGTRVWSLSQFRHHPHLGFRFRHDRFGRRAIIRP